MKKITSLICAACIILSASCGDMLTDALDDVNLEYYFYVVYSGSTMVSIYKISSNGELQFITNCDLSIQPYSIKVHPNQDYVYIIGESTDTLFGFKIDNKGLLEFISGNQAGDSPHSICIHPDGNHIYSVNQGTPETLSQFEINGNGKLVNNNKTYPTSPSPYFGIMDYRGENLYLTNESPGYCVSWYPVDSAGNLGTRTDYTIPSSREPVIHPEGNFIYIPQSNLNSVRIIPINADGSLNNPSSTTCTLSGAYTSGVYPGFSVFNKTGEFFYVPIFNNNTGNTIDVFRWDTDGSLTPVETVTSDTGPYGVITHPDLNILYCANIAAGTITIYSIADDGRLTAIGSPVPCKGSTPLRMVIAKRHRFTE